MAKSKKRKGHNKKIANRNAEFKRQKQAVEKILEDLRTGRLTPNPEVKPLNEEYLVAPRNFVTLTGSDGH